MIVGQGYTQILEMIMKRLQPAFIQGSEYIVRGNSSPPLPEVEGSKDNPYDPKGVNAFEDFDYHLEYNDEDELIWFTSHDGTIKYMLNKDSFEDLVTITVLTTTIDFKIALIYENYDVRESGPEVEEKGKLTDVVIMTMDGNPFPLGLSIRPSQATVMVGDSIQFKAYITNVDGTTVEVTQSASWSCSNPLYNIDGGLILNAQLGTAQVSALYQMVVAYAEVEVIDFEIIVEPQSVIVEYQGTPETIHYKAFKIDSIKGSRSDITDDCIWSTTKWIGQMDRGAYAVTVNSSGTATVTARYVGKTASAEIESGSPEIIISPSNIEVIVGNPANFKALIASSRVNVTDQCVWNTTKWNGNIISNYYQIIPSSEGSSTITATYQGKSATAQLVSDSEYTPPVEVHHDYDYLVKLSWYGDDDVDLVGMIDENQWSVVNYSTGQHRDTPAEWSTALSTYVETEYDNSIIGILALDQDDVARITGEHTEMLTVIGFNQSVLNVYFNVYRVNENKDAPITVKVYQLNNAGESLLKTYTFNVNDIPDNREYKHVCSIDLDTGVITP